MMAEPVMRHFRMRSIIDISVPGVTTSYSQVLNADPTRWSILMPCPSAGNLYFGFGEAQPSAAQFTTSASLDPFLLTEDWVGSLIQLPLWCKVSTGTYSPSFVTVSYDPMLKAEMDEYVRRHLSHARTP